MDSEDSWCQAHHPAVGDNEASVVAFQTPPFFPLFANLLQACMRDSLERTLLFSCLVYRSAMKQTDGIVWYGEDGYMPAGNGFLGAARTRVTEKCRSGMISLM